jgi:hypothetical protein
MGPDPFVADLDEVGFRYSSYDTPFWARPNSVPGRWHDRGDGPTQYLSLSAAGSWAELIRRERVSSEGEVAQVRIQMWIVEMSLGDLADYRDFDRADAAGFPPDALVDDDYRRCQAEARRLRAEGFGGVIAPSAALPGEVNVTVFGPRYSVRWGARPVLASAMPAAVVAVGCPPAGLVGRVRQLGDRHAALREHEIVAAARLGEQLRRHPRETPDLPGPSDRAE